MDIDATERFKLLIALIGILTLGGLLMITLLLVLWRRFNDRQARLGVRKAGQGQGPQQDLWYESGQRLTRQLEQGDADEDDHDTPTDPSHDDSDKP